MSKENYGDNNTLDILIAEPWNFESSTGQNHLLVEIIDNSELELICRSISEFDNMSKYLLIELRHNTWNEGLNIYKILSDANSFEKLNYDDLEFIMIGSLKYKKESLIE